MAPLRPDVVLAAIVGHEPLVRTEMTRRIWDYIVEHNLQDPQQEWIIHCDDRLRALTGKDHIDLFELTRPARGRGSAPRMAARRGAVQPVQPAPSVLGSRATVETPFTILFCHNTWLETRTNVGRADVKRAQRAAAATSRAILRRALRWSDRSAPVAQDR
jgi:hypothetical protein